MMQQKITSLAFAISLITGSAQAAVLSQGLQSTLEHSASQDQVSIILRFSRDEAMQAEIKSLRQELHSLLRQSRSGPPSAAVKESRRALRKQLLISLKQQLNLMLSSNARALAQAGTHQRDLWIINGMSLKVPAFMVNMLSQLPDVERISLDATLSAPATPYTPTGPVDWNLTRINAPTLWSLGYTGQDVVVASMDTGVDVNHPDIAPRWRGGDNSWFDPHGEHATPHDASGHGTHSLGIIIGGEDSGSPVGVAPGSQWIAAKIFDDSGFSTLSTIHMGYQWLLDPDGDPSIDDAPDVVNNSWGFENLVNVCDNEFADDIQALKDADIAVSFAAGNFGPNTASAVSPASLPGILSTGATDQNDDITTFSSRGPSPCDGAYFPTVVAPGDQIRTPDLTFGGLFPDSYTWVSGTSFAVSHTTGVIALLKSALPQASAAQIEQAITESATDLGATGSDNDSGRGMINADAAYTRLQELVTTTPNQAPVANTDQYGLNQGASLNVNSANGVLSNDSDPDGNALTARLVQGPAHGSLTLKSDGGFNYQHDGSNTLSDSFSYHAHDGDLNSADTQVSLSMTPQQNTAPVTSHDRVNGTVNTPLIINVLSNDSDAEGNLNPASVEIVSAPNRGGQVSVNPDGSLNYTPRNGWSGREIIKYRVSDHGSLVSNTSKVIIRVKRNAAPRARGDSFVISRTATLIRPMDNDSDDQPLNESTLEIVTPPNAGGHAVVESDGQITFTPANSGKNDKFKYRLNDKHGAKSRTVTVKIKIVN